MAQLAITSIVAATPAATLVATLTVAATLTLTASLTLVDPAHAQTLASRYIEELTWTEIQGAMDTGNTTVIVPIGGTEQNGPHMVVGKHNYIITFAAGEMAERLGNALIAPTIKYVPEGDYTDPEFGEKPGEISNPEPSYRDLLDAAARSLEAHGFTEILFIGDSGGDQEGMVAVAEQLNDEWAGRSTRVYALTDYYSKGNEYARAWLRAKYGYDMETIGGHAGITDTSAIMYVFPSGIRWDKLMPGGGGADSGVRGDPTKATAEIGRMVIEFKVNAGLAQYQALTAPTGGRRTGGF